uniref:Syndecan n=1 Tax=Arion vulgaris TaxID=1028688 RepID=A0A0B7AAN4_9EUPU
MPWEIYFTFVAVLWLSGYTNARVELDRSWGLTWNAKKTNSNIIFDKEPIDTVAGSGDWMLHASDDEDLVESGSGSGSGMGEISPDASLEKATATTMTAATTTTTTTTTIATTSRPLTACEKLRQASQQLSNMYVPRCLPNGEFDSLQCQGQPGIGDCWCSDLEGHEIPGSLKEAPDVPACDSGHNLHLCVHQLVQHVRSKILGSFRPRCTNDGQFDRIQCHGSMCFCVDEDTGSRMTGSEVHIPDIPRCDDDTADIIIPELTTDTSLLDTKDKTEGSIYIDETEKPKIIVTEVNSETIDIDPDIGGPIDKDKKLDQTKPTYKEENVSGPDKEKKSDHKSDHEGHHGDKMEKAGEIMTQPGILAGVIGGSVVLLLCVVLLVMFIVYRMRKKDEGSYPLDEPRKAPNYNYVRAPEKEFYA